jgi:hypothetical protein
MNRILNCLSVLYLIWTIFIITLLLSGKITFGQGIGDFFYLILISVLFIVFGFVSFLNYKGKIKFPNLLSILAIIILILFTLKMTIWRGIEYPWNGKIFY